MMIREWLKSNNHRILVLISIAVVFLILLFVLFTHINGGDNNSRDNALTGTTSPTNAVEETPNATQAVEESTGNHAVIEGETSNETISNETGNAAQPGEESSGSGAAFEEEEVLTDPDPNNNSGGTEEKEPQKPTEPKDTPTTAEDNRNPINEETTGAGQDATEETTLLPPTAPNQDGEWGNPVQN